MENVEENPGIEKYLSGDEAAEGFVKEWFALDEFEQVHAEPMLGHHHDAEIIRLHIIQ